MFLALELCLTAIAAALAFIRPELGERWFSRLETWLGSLARKRALAAILIGLLALALRAALLPILPIPQPEVHDEYSHLLLADTLAHGRLTNPTHPMWVHLETFHVNWQPTYASMYYPGHALFLALGQQVMGHPFWGVWLSSGLMCGAICWALQAWMPAEWALLGGFLAVIRLGTFSYWANSYWGGTVSALGGALVLGALPRIREDRQVRDAVLLGIGMAVLAATRPYEGLFFCAPVIVVLVRWVRRAGFCDKRRLLMHVMAPISLVILCAVAALGYYFWRVTGSPFTIPYQLNVRSYGLVYFPWNRIKPVEFHHLGMQLFYRGDPVVGVYNFARQHPLQLQFFKALVIWLFYFGPALSLPVLAWIFTRPRGRFWHSISSEIRFILLVCSATYISIMLTIYIGQPHYAAPLTAAFYCLILLAMRDLWSWRWRGSPSGRFLVRVLPLVCIVLLLARTGASVVHLAPKPSWVRTWCSEDWQNLERARVLKQLENMPGEQLVIVRYFPGHDFILNEWVFNGADIDGSKVVWARDMGPEQNAELLQHFHNRRVWLVEPDKKPVQIVPYMAPVCCIAAAPTATAEAH
jgi:hypothetical protein